MAPKQHNESDKRIVVMSIHPTWVDSIAAGNKCVELRRRPPFVYVPTDCVIYATSPRARLELRCSIGPTSMADLDHLWRDFGPASKVTRIQFDNYFEGL